MDYSLFAECIQSRPGGKETPPQHQGGWIEIIACDLHCRHIWPCGPNHRADLSPVGVPVGQLLMPSLFYHELTPRIGGAALWSVDVAKISCRAEVTIRTFMFSLAAWVNLNCESLVSFLLAKSGLDVL
jgi:hypothetical protein